MIGSINSSSYTNSLRNMNSIGRKADRLREQMSSGKRITSFAVDAAGGAIAEKMRAQFEQYDVEIRNYEDSINRYKTEEGAYTGLSENLQEIRKLQIQARNDTLTDEDKAKIQDQIDLQIESMRFISDSAEFNTKKLVKPDGELKDILENGIDAQGDLIDDAINQIAQKRSQLGAKINSTEKNIDQKMISYENTQAAYSTIADMDLAHGSLEKAKFEIMKNIGVGNLQNIMSISKNNVLNLLG